MARFVKHVKTWLKEEEGAAAVEYAVLLALIVVACLGTIKILGGKANETFSKVNAGLESSAQ